MGHKKIQVKLKEIPTGQPFSNISASARNLRITDLGSIIFGCKHSTFRECISKQLFGLPESHYAYVRNIKPGLPLFLFNYTDRRLHGIFEAESEGRKNINKYAWTFDGDEATQFPAQVKVRVQRQCQPLTEQQFKPIIAENYYERTHFWFELDKAQTRQIIALFLESAVPRSHWLSQGTSKLDTAGHKANRLLERGATSLCTSNEGQALVSHVQKELTASSPAKSWSSLFKHPLESKAIKEQETSSSLNLCNQESEIPNNTCPSKFDMDWESIFCSDGEITVHGDQTHDCFEDQRHEKDANNGGMHLDGSEESFEENFLDVPEETSHHSNESSIVSDDDTKTVLSEKYSHQSNMEWGFSATGKQKDGNEAKTLVSISDDVIDLSSLTEETILKMTLSDLRAFALEIFHAKEMMKSSQSMQDQTIHSLKQKQELVESKSINETVKQQFRVHESSSCVSVGLADDQLKTSLDTSLKIRDSILLVGGYDGSLFLPTLEVFAPSVDNVRSLKSMGTVRPYASSVQLNNGLYVLGGGDGKLWYDTVECYNLRNDCWVSCPSLSKKKGSLAGIGSDNKIFAIGGGNGTECFSDVEMLDLGFGKWISTPSMLQKRFAAAAAEVKGRLYVVGGYDGKNYLSSMEGFDPREPSWTRLQSMHTKRGCHAVTVLNEKLYAIGGCDFTGMFSSVEVYDPRLGSWMMAEPMNYARGYFGATAVASMIYSIGGVSKSGQILASVECYSEGCGWQMTKLRSVGKKSAFSAVAVAL